MNKHQMMLGHARPVAVHSEGLELYAIDYGIDDRALIKRGESVHLVRINYGNRDYVTIGKRRYFMNDFLRI